MIYILNTLKGVFFCCEKFFKENVAMSLNVSMGVWYPCGDVEPFMAFKSRFWRRLGWRVEFIRDEFTAKKSNGGEKVAERTENKRR